MSTRPAPQTFELDAARIDWAQLRQQKRWLVARAAEGSDSAEGLLNFIDYVQDSAVEQHARTDAEVFGWRHVLAGLKRCIKCGRIIARPYLADDENERCARCADS